MIEKRIEQITEYLKEHPVIVIFLAWLINQGHADSFFMMFKFKNIGKKKAD